MALKVSANLGKALDNLRSFAGENLKDPQPINTVNVTEEGLTTLTKDYNTTLASGTERGVTVDDLEAAGNFYRDMHSMGKVLNSEIGAPYMEANPDVDSIKTTINLPIPGGNGLSVTSALYRPGKEEELDNNYSAITRTWAPSEDDKFIDAHLAELTAKLKSKKK